MILRPFSGAAIAFVIYSSQRYRGWRSALMPEEKDEKNPFDFEDTGFHQPPGPPPPPAPSPAPPGDTEGVVEFEEVGPLGAAAGGSPAPAPEKPAPPPAPAKPAPASGKPATPVRPPRKPGVARPSAKRPATRRPSARAARPPASPVGEAAAKAPAAPASVAPAPPKVVRRSSPAVVALMLIFLLAAAGAGYLYFRTAKELKAKNDEIASKDDELSGLRTDLKAKENELKAAKGEMEKLRADIQGKDGRIKELSGALSAEKDLNELLTRKSKGLRERADRAEALEWEMKTLKSKATGLEEQLAAKESELKEAGDALQREKKAGRAAVEKVAGLERELARVRKRLRDIERHGVGDERLTATINELQGRLKESRKEIERLNRELAGQKVPTGGSRALRAKVVQLRRELAKKSRELAALASQLMASESRRRAYSSPLETIKEWEAALNGRDVNGAMRLYSSKSSLWRRWTGAAADAVREEFRRFVAGGKIGVKVNAVTIRDGVATADLTIVRGAEAQRSIPARMVLVREDGEWKIQDEGF